MYEFPFFRLCIEMLLSLANKELYPIRDPIKPMTHQTVPQVKVMCHMSKSLSIQTTMTYLAPTRFGSSLHVTI